MMRLARPFVVGGVLLLMAGSLQVFAANAQDGEPPPEITGEDPGEPPPFDIAHASVNEEMSVEEWQVYCDSNWCVAMGEPDEIEIGVFQHGLACWNGSGPVCVVAAAGPEASSWLAAYATYIANAYGNTSCLLLDYTCPIQFPGNWFGTSVEDSGDDDDGPGEGSPPPVNGACPAPTIVRGEIRAEGRLIDPSFPVVAGQDSLKRGADLQWVIEISPVIHTWYEAEIVGTQQICVYDPTGNGAGCPGPGSQYDEVVGSDTGWHSFMASGDTARFWNSAGGAPIVNCIRHVDVYPERLADVGFHASLKQKSRDWILGELASRYPGAGLYQPDWSWFPPIAGRVNGSGIFFWELTQTRIPFRDPGEYSHFVQGTTSGTPVTDPRAFTIPLEDFTIWLHEATLTR